MNYAFVNWSRFLGSHTVTLEARLGFGCGVGDYGDHENFFSLEAERHFRGEWPWVMVQYRYGFDGTMCPCVEGASPPMKELAVLLQD